MTTIGGWYTFPKNTYQHKVYIELCCENCDGGGFWVRMPSLPGCVSQGDTIEECLFNIQEAFQGLRDSYKRHNEEIPWVIPEEPKPGTIVRVITINY
jgi:predicted RNase H-like HicB family nuclease